MGGLTSPLLVWVIYPDQNITRRKWRHKAYCDALQEGFADAKFGTLIEAILERPHDEIRLKLSNGQDCVISRVPTPNKDDD